MRRVVVRYKVKPDRIDEHQGLIERVFAGLEETQPEGLRYASLRLEDGLSFVHVAFVETRDGSNPLSAQPEFTEFTRDLEARCDEPPVATDVSVVGAYRLFES